MNIRILILSAGKIGYSQFTAGWVGHINLAVIILIIIVVVVIIER